ncbi:MAG: hypothetical protein PHW50_03355, partial [Patescibacteria group bacterium]|nr:hypothetical protein [Patescibacteria group bacterium]
NLPGFSQADPAADSLERLLPFDPNNIPAPVDLTPEEDAYFRKLALHFRDLKQKIKTSIDPKEKEQAFVEIEALAKQIETEYTNLRHTKERQKRLEQGEAEISSDDLKLNQNLFNLLAQQIPELSNINLEQELRAGNILLPTPEQKEQAEELGLTLSLIVPGQIPRKQLLEYFQSTDYQTDFEANAVEYYQWEDNTTHEIFDANLDKDQTQAALHPTRPNQFYTILVSPEQLVRKIHDQHEQAFGVFGQSPKTYLNQLTKLNQDYPDLLASGLTLPEYLLLDCLMYLKTKQASGIGSHLDGEGLNRSWLLEEKTRARCLNVGWYPDHRRLHVYSFSLDDVISVDGVRFAAVSKAA